MRTIHIPIWFIVKCLIGLSAAFALAWLGLAARAIYQDAVEVRPTIAALAPAVASVKNTSETVNTEVKMNGQMAYKVLLESALTVRQTRMAAESQRKFWDKEMPRIAQKAEGTLDQSTALVASLRKTSDSLRQDGQDLTGSTVEVLHGLKPTLSTLPELTAALTGTSNAITGTANKASVILGDPSIPLILRDAHETGQQVVGVAQHANHIMGNLDQKIDTALHPTVWGQIKGYALLGLGATRSVVETLYYWP